MKNWMNALCVSAFVLSSAFAEAQVVTPPASPGGVVSQVVGLTDVKIDYSRPAVKGRKIFGDLLAFDSLWRTGANGSTKITLSDSAKIGGFPLSKGTYSIFSIPGRDMWTIIINKNTSFGGTGGYKQSEDACRFMAKPMKLNDKVENLTFNFANITANGADIELMWENTKVSFPLTVLTEDKVMASIKTTMDGPSAGSLSSAASYYLDTNKDPNQALSWMNQALAKGGDRFFLLRTKALIQAKTGDYAGAIVTAKKSTELAIKEGNSDYVKMNEKSIAEWVKK